MSSILWWRVFGTLRMSPQAVSVGHSAAQVPQIHQAEDLHLLLPARDAYLVNVQTELGSPV